MLHLFIARELHSPSIVRASPPWVPVWSASTPKSSTTIMDTLAIFGLQCRWRYLPAIGNLSSFTIHPTGPVLDHATWCPSQGPVTLPHETDEHQYSDTALTAAWHGILVGVFVGLGQHLTSEHWSEVIGARCKQIFTSAAQRCGEQDRTGGRTSSPG